MQTYRQLRERADAHRAALASIGVGRGDRVAWQLAKSPAVLALHLALLEAGAVQLPLNPAYPDRETAALLQDAAPALLVRDPARSELTGPWLSHTLAADGSGSWAELSASGLEPPDPPPLGPDDGAALLYTSGTTGRPKGALLSHGNLRHNAQVLVDAWGFGRDDVQLHVLPLFHTHGLFVAVHCALASGSSLELHQAFDVEQTLDALPRCTVMMGVPTHYTRLLADPRFGRESVSNVRLLVSGSAPMSASLHEQVAARTGLSVLERYGMTETAMLTSNPLEGVRKPGSVGPALPGVRLRVVDDAGTALSGDEIGHVQVRGPNVFAGYWGRPELASETFTADGWFRTGDLGRLDADGYLELVGRSKDLVISGGLNVYPKDVERVLDEVAGVVESAVVGLPDADLGERVVAAVVVRESTDFDSDTVRSRLRQSLAPYQVPKQITVVDGLPRNAMGKVEKARLRDLLLAPADEPGR